MKWVTREKAKVDRIACPWLIEKFVDKSADFLFVPPDKIPQIAREEGAIPYDCANVELTHYKEDGKEYVSFDAIIKKYNLKDPALLELAKIVRGADAKIPNPPAESAGLEAVAHGFRNLAKDDFDNMRLQFPTYDALYKFCQLKVEGIQKLEYNVSQPAR
ncbi:chromate resistance protein [Candidatus Bathyarchaeota archaeon]|nr:MAG: chromate resistance protein [Candidatus Bathyarchaeota archaeon]